MENVHARVLVVPKIAVNVLVVNAAQNAAVKVAIKEGEFVSPSFILIMV